MRPASQFVDEVRDVVVPHRAGRYGPLPPLLLGLTVVTGLVDAFSYLLLGHVFVANMTGNVVFLGFAIAGAPGFSIAASLVALGSFMVGALFGGKVASRLGQHRGHLLTAATSLQVLLLGASVVVAAASGDPVTGAARYTLIVVLGTSMGVQNAAARKLAVPDLTTTVLTLTITGVAADSAIAGGKGSAAGRRLVAVTAMFLGALAGAALVLHVHIVGPLALALIITAVVALVSWRASATDPSWVHPS
ncbi:MAG TPA: YoaK family protein [Acidimicrobiia bacterium]